MQELAVPEVHTGTLQTGKHYVVLVQYVDFRPIGTPTVRGVARFTKKTESPSETGLILLRTPEYYREWECGDPRDGALEGNIAPFIADRLRRPGFAVSERNLNAVVTMTSQREPWIFCTSIRPSLATGATSLEDEFSYCGRDGVVTTVDDQNAFAKQLGIDVARSAELKDSVTDELIDVLGRRAAQACGEEVDVVVRVSHGPVRYKDVTLKVRTRDDLANAEAYQAWFTKRTRFSDEREYRFVVSAGCPTKDTFRLDVSPELSRLTRPWRFRDRWWCRVDDWRGGGRRRG